MGLLFDQETRLEQELPVRLQGNRQESLDSYRPQDRKCGLVMHRNCRHRCSRPIATRYGVLELQVPVFRCGDCRSMTSSAELLGDEERYGRYSKKGPTGLCDWLPWGRAMPRPAVWRAASRALFAAGSDRNQ